MKNKQDRKIVDVREILTDKQEYIIPSQDCLHQLLEYKIEFDKDWIVNVDIPVNKEKTKYHRLMIKRVENKNDVHTNDTITINKIYRFSEIANWLSEGLPLEQYLNFDVAVGIIRIAFKKWLIKEKMAIAEKEKILNNLSYTMETLDIHRQIMEEEKEKK